MGFVKYENVGGRIGSPQISIWTRGQIGFNQAAILKYKIDNYKYAVLYYDKEGKRIGIRLTNNEEETAKIKLVFRKNGGVSFSAMSFLKTYEIDYEKKTQKYDFTYDAESDMFIVQLPNEESSFE